MEKDKRSILDEMNECERSIRERAEELKRPMDEQRKKLLNKLVKVRNATTKKIKTRKEEVTRQVMMLESFKNYVEELVEKGSACVISQSARDLLARAKQLHAAQVEFSKGSLCPDRVTFESANVANITSGRIDFIGWISVDGERFIFVI